MVSCRNNPNAAIAFNLGFSKRIFICSPLNSIQNLHNYIKLLQYSTRCVRYFSAWLQMMKFRSMKIQYTDD